MLVGLYSESVCPQPRADPRNKNRPEGLLLLGDAPGKGAVLPQAAFFSSKNCSSSVEPFRAPVEASASMVVVTASK